MGHVCMYIYLYIYDWGWLGGGGVVGGQEGDARRRDAGVDDRAESDVVPHLGDAGAVDPYPFSLVPATLPRQLDVTSFESRTPATIGRGPSSTSASGFPAHETLPWREDEDPVLLPGKAAPFSSLLRRSDPLPLASCVLKLRFNLGYTRRRYSLNSPTLNPFHYNFHLCLNDSSVRDISRRWQSYLFNCRSVLISGVIFKTLIWPFRYVSFLQILKYCKYTIP